MTLFRPPDETAAAVKQRLQRIRRAVAIQRADRVPVVLEYGAFAARAPRTPLPEYLLECQARGILQVRIVHGKGIGNLRRTVHALLGRLPTVAHFELAGGDAGSWGATLVDLHAPDPE